MQHHAYYIEGSLSQFGAYKEALKPFWACEFERFGVDEARELIALAALKNVGEAVFLVGVSQITTEAQQALLKLLEEPQQGTTFIFLVPHGVLLPTVKSRMMVWPEQRGGQNGLASPATERHADLQDEENRGPFGQHAAQGFFKASQKERSEMIGELLDDDEGVRERARDFVAALEVELAKDARKHAQALHDLSMVRDYLRDRSPSLKMLLEHLALSLPKQ